MGSTCRRFNVVEFSGVARCATTPLRGRADHRLLPTTRPPGPAASGRWRETGRLASRPRCSLRLVLSGPTGNRFACAHSTGRVRLGVIGVSLVAEGVAQTGGLSAGFKTIW